MVRPSSNRTCSSSAWSGSRRIDPGHDPRKRTIRRLDPPGHADDRPSRQAGAGRPGHDQARPRLGLESPELGQIAQFRLADRLGLLVMTTRPAASVTASAPRLEPAAAASNRVRRLSPGSRAATSGRAARARRLAQAQVVAADAVTHALLDHRHEIPGVAAGIQPRGLAQIDAEIGAEQGHADEQARARDGDQTRGAICEMRADRADDRSQGHGHRVNTAAVERGCAVAGSMIGAQSGRRILNKPLLAKLQSLDFAATTVVAGERRAPDRCRGEWAGHPEDRSATGRARPDPGRNPSDGAPLSLRDRTTSQ